MHIDDGVVPPAVQLAGAAAATALAAWTVPRLAKDSPPRIAMITAALFAATLIGLPVPGGGTRVHLVGIGLAGVVLGRGAFAAVLVALVLQRLLLQVGGVTTLGVNATTLGVGALVTALAFHLPRRAAGPLDERARRRLTLRAGLAAALGTAASLVLYAGALLSAEAALRKVAWICIVAHGPVLVIEAVMTASVVGFLLRVQPELVGAGAPASPREPAAP